MNQRYSHSMGLGGLKILFAAFFVYAALVQINDPDGVVWMFTYAIAATLTVMSFFSAYHLVLTAGFCVICIAWSLVVLPASLESEMSFAKEEPRELFGLLIIAAWMLWLTVHHRIRQRDDFLSEPAKFPSSPP